MKDKKLINKCKREIKARILEAGYTMAEAMGYDLVWVRRRDD